MMDGLELAHESKYRADDDHGYFAGNMDKGVVARLRLDWELSTKAVVEHKDIKGLMRSQIEDDLRDLLENGDINNLSDPLLKTMDGSKKRGMEPVDVDIFVAQLFKEHKERKSATEFTLYMCMYVEWPV